MSIPIINNIKPTKEAGSGRPLYGKGLNKITEDTIDKIIFTVCVIFMIIILSMGLWINKCQ